MNRSLIFLSVFCGLLAMSTTGCIRYHDWSNELHVKKLACKSYKSRYSYDPSFKHARHFERGWKEGYTDVALGGDGNPPTFPPVPYRSFKYRNPEGHQIVDIWFEAYREGANAAISEGVQHFNYLPTSRSQHYREVIHPGPADAIQASPAAPVIQGVPTEVMPPREVPPPTGGAAPMDLNEDIDESLSVPQVMMELQQAPESIGGHRLTSGVESEDKGVIFVNFDQAE
ncbi:MAG: hypothetical protein CMJ46_16500 [Planctomyces sp.]|nr:hypothetical protein [Planctomyces sp.]